MVPAKVRGGRGIQAGAQGERQTNALTGTECTGVWALPVSNITLALQAVAEPPQPP